MNRSRGRTSTPLPRHYLYPIRAVFAILSIATVVFFIGGLIIFYRNTLSVPAETASALADLGLTSRFYATYHTISVGLLFAAFTVAALILIWRRPPDDWLSLLVAFALIGQGANAFLPLKLMALEPGWTIPVRLTASFILTALPLACYLFPEGKFRLQWTRPLLILWFAWLGSSALWRGSPLNIFEFFETRKLVYLLSILLVTGSGVVALIYQYRNYASAVQRQQTKWIIFGVAVAVIMGVGMNMVGVALNALGASPPVQVIGSLAAQTLSMLAQLIIPIGFIFAILRYRLWDIDLVINRSLVYGAVTVALGIIFVGSVLVLERILEAVTADRQASIALGLSSLGIALIFNPVRSQIQRFFDRRFFAHEIQIEPRPVTSSGSTNFVSFNAGKRFGQYEVTGDLGRGGMAEVYLGKHFRVGREVAIKVLSTHLAQDESFRLRFEREAQTIASLSHPNIVQLYDFGNTGGSYYMVMEYLPGKDLAQYIHECGRMTLDQALPLIEDIASALSYAHSQGVVHRDIKPSNVMLTIPTMQNSRPFRAVLTDFGIARIVTGSTRLTKTGMVGTLEYIAPEQIESGEVDGRADIYALGVMLYQMLTGELPFKGENPAAIILAHLQQVPPDPRTVVPDLPLHVVQVIQRALAKNPAGRFKTVGEMIGELQPVYSMAA